MGHPFSFRAQPLTLYLFSVCVEIWPAKWVTKQNPGSTTINIRVYLRPGRFAKDFLNFHGQGVSRFLRRGICQQASLLARLKDIDR